MLSQAEFIAHANRMIAVAPTKELQVICKGEYIQFQSALSDDAAQDGLRYVPGSFAKSLWDASYSERGLSPKQLAWAHKLTIDWLKSQSQSLESLEFDSLFAAFDAARARGAKRLILRFNGFNVKPNRDGTALWITSSVETEEGQYGLQPKYLGKVTRTGMDSRIPDHVKKGIMLIASDPLSATVKYGRETGECSCCGRELTDPKSIAQGIGPICKEKFGW